MSRNRDFILTDNRMQSFNFFLQDNVGLRVLATFSAWLRCIGHRRILFSKLLRSPKSRMVCLIRLIRMVQLLCRKVFPPCLVDYYNLKAAYDVTVVFCRGGQQRRRRDLDPWDCPFGHRITALSAVFTDVAICVNSGLKIPKQHVLVPTTKLK